VGKDLKIISNPHKQVILTEMIHPRGGRLESHKSHLKCRRICAYTIFEEIFYIKNGQTVEMICESSYGNKQKHEKFRRILI